MLLKCFAASDVGLLDDEVGDLKSLQDQGFALSLCFDTAKVFVLSVLHATRQTAQAYIEVAGHLASPTLIKAKRAAKLVRVNK